MRLMRSHVTSTFLYACKSWTLTAELQRRIQAMEIRYYRKILRISYKDHRPCNQRRSLCQSPAGIRTTRKSPYQKETQTDAVWTCLPSHMPHNERGKKTRQREKEVERQHQRKDMPGVRQVPKGSEEQVKMQETGCEVICGAPTTLAV